MITRVWAMFQSARGRALHSRSIEIASLLVVVLSSRVFAQPSREATDAKLRASCRLAVQTLEKGHPAPKSAWALSMIYACDESGGRALEGLWSAASTDSIALEQLVDASATLLDRRVYASVLNAARNTATPRVVRLAALRVLGAYISPNTVIAPDELAKPHRDSSAILLFGTVDHAPYQNVGAQPLPPNTRNEIRDLFAGLWHSDPDAVIRRAGRSLSLRFF